MSIALLQDEKHKHEILDDRKSVFHILTWSALYYTSHSHQDNMELYLKPYDKVVVLWNTLDINNFILFYFIFSDFTFLFLYFLFWRQ